MTSTPFRKNDRGTSKSENPRAFFWRGCLFLTSQHTRRGFSCPLGPVVTLREQRKQFGEKRLDISISAILCKVVQLTDHPQPHYLVLAEEQRAKLISALAEPIEMRECCCGTLP